MRPALAAVLTGALVNVVPCAAASPVAKVADLLKELRSKVSNEGNAEALTYNEFACFCKSSMAAKTSAISKGEVDRNALQAQLNEASSRRDQEDQSIMQKEQAIQSLEAEIVKLKGDRHVEALDYAKSEVDLTKAIQGLDAAIHALKTTKTATGLVQLSERSQALRRAAAMAEDMQAAAADREAVDTGSRQNREVPDSIYDFHADDIIATLLDLKNKFDAKKVELDARERSARDAFQALLQDKEAAVREHVAAVESPRRAKAAETQKIAFASQDLTVASAQLLNDRKYLGELGAQCHEKAALWDQRTQARQNEMVALSNVLDMLQSLGAVPGERALSFLELGTGGNHRDASTSSQGASAGRTRAAVQLGVNVQELQPVNVHLRGGHDNSAAPVWRQQAAALLRTKAGDLHSALLLRLASEVTEDPFVKVKQLIQQLIERLVKEAQAEVNHKGWCDKQIALAQQARDRSADSIMEVNARLEVGEPHRAKLASQIQALNEDLHSTNTTLADINTTREQESMENQVAIEDAKNGSAAVTQAITILRRFYQEAANNATAFAQMAEDRAVLRGLRGTLEVRTFTGNTPGGDAADGVPEVGFRGAYAGSQGVKEGILGLLDVIKSDYERTISEVTAAEAKAKQGYLELQRTTRASKAEKEQARLAYEGSLREADSQDQQDRSSLANLQTELDAAVRELEALREPCAGGGMSASERKIQREEEMEALRKVLCILEQHGIGGTDIC